MLGFHIPAAPPLYTNTFLLISDAGHAVIIDPAAEADSYDEILKQHNATLTTILCTHGHYDHVGSAAALKAEWNATLYCEKADLAGDRMYPLSAADCGYTEGEQIAVDELRFTAWHTPGHTPGSVVLLCGEHLFCGDTLFAGSIGRTDLEGGSSAQMADSLRKLAQLPIPRETQVLPGHGEFSTFGTELDNNYYIRSALRGGNDIF
jgi:hydroxyacylglutathione hydrolase